ncbi:MAG TPA: response regulator [Anaerolineales bacterium]|nr:response regulator [Anaerolineales bacterium]
MKKQPFILIVDDDPDILDGITAVLETRPYRLATARDGLQCMELVRQETPDLLILDMLMPRMDGFAVIRSLRSDPKYAGVPIIVLTTVIEDAAYRRYELETGIAMDIQGYLEKPGTPDDLLRKVSNIVDQPFIIVADDDPDILEAVTTVLATQPYRVATAQDGMQCLEIVRKQTPDLLILDLLMPRMDGFGVIRELRSDPAFSGLPILVLTTVVEDASRRRYELETGQDLRVRSYLQKPVSPQELLRIVGQALESVHP